ncbi:MAG: arylamine N-acetyltransferase family protein [Rubrivivax sp.]|jgi:N-hydroxyarylamine O-acetyltransferase
MDAACITDRYLETLGLERRPPDLALLREIARRHVARWPFSSVGTNLAEDLPLDLASLYDRIVVRQRGGYCFEHNGLVHDVLVNLGYRVVLTLGRVASNRSAHPGLTHRISLVDCAEGRQLVDVGFGPMGPDGPVAWTGEPREPGSRSFRVAEPRPGEFHLQTWKDEAWSTLYRFELARYGQADCELGHFYSHRHPEAVFVNNLVASRILHDETRSLRNASYRILRAAGDRETAIVSAGQLHRILVEDFGLALTEVESAHLHDRFVRAGGVNAPTSGEER